jgi:large conductance mechanosensitive channel
MLREFKEFALRGNVVELAAAVILGLAFNAVVQSLVDDVLMNFIAAIAGRPDFSNLTFRIGEGQIGYGAFLTAVVNFLLIAFVLFILVRTVNRLRGPAEEVAEQIPCPFCRTSIPAEASRCPACTSDIRPATA